MHAASCDLHSDGIGDTRVSTIGGLGLASVNDRPRGNRVGERAARAGERGERKTRGGRAVCGARGPACVCTLVSDNQLTSGTAARCWDISEVFRQFAPGVLARFLSSPRDPRLRRRTAPAVPAGTGRCEHPRLTAHRRIRVSRSSRPSSG